MAKNKGKRRSKASQNKQSSPSKNASSGTSRETSPGTSDAHISSTDRDSQLSSGPSPQTQQDREPGAIRKVSARVAQFEEAARAGSLLNHERSESSIVSPPQASKSPPKPAVLGSPLLADRARGTNFSDSNKMEDTPIQNTFFEAAANPATPMKSPLTSQPGDESFVDRAPQELDATQNEPQDEIAAIENEMDRSPHSIPFSPEPQIPQRSVARAVEPETVQTFEAKRVMIGRPVMLENIDDSRDQVESDVDLDSYFDSPDDVVITAATVRKIDSPEVSQSPRFAEQEFDMDSTEQDLPSAPAAAALEANGSETVQRSGEDNGSSGKPASASNGLRIEKLRSNRPVVTGMPSPHAEDNNGSGSEVVSEESLRSPVKSPRSIRVITPKASEPGELHESSDIPAAPATKISDSHHLSLGDEHLPPPPALSANSSPLASPRAYKYEQSPIPKPDESRTEPPIIGVCVVGFHHQRGPEVEYWVGPDESQSTMWPYLPFQSLPDGSHQFEENVTYFMLLYDRNRHAATSLTFDRDEDGHIRQGTTDFRNVTTLFAVACSRQVPASDLKLSEDEQYTRSTVQKSVVVIASKPLFGPIKEKLTVVTRSYFAQHNFGDRAIIDHFYHNLVQMPLWTNENDLHVGMNLQKCIHDFGAQALYIFKAMLLETKILFYASDTDVLGTTQFALVSLIPNLINHLEDSGSPLLSSYEMNLQRPTHLRSSDRQSLLKYMGLPLQLFAGGGVFSPFVPLQQFDDLKQPETQYGMMGTTNKLFLGTDIDFDVVVNVDTSEVVARNPEVGALLQLTDQDKAFINTVKKAVDTAWDTDDSWQPQALVYHGGEDYIRHEFEEYLMALLASAKYARYGGSDQSFPANPLQHYGTAWSERWMRTNNFRISDRNTDRSLFEIVDPIHPGVRLQKPSGIERFFGIFKSNNAKNIESPVSSSASVASQTSSNPRTPSLASGEKFADQPGQQHPAPTTPSTPRRWFWQSEPRDRGEPVRSAQNGQDQKLTAEKRVQDAA